MELGEGEMSEADQLYDGDGGRGNWTFGVDCFVVHTDVKLFLLYTWRGFPGSSNSKESACNEENQCLLPALGGSPGEGNGNPLQYSCLENPMDRGTWWTTVRWVTKSQTQLSDFYFHTWSLYNVTYQFYLNKIKSKNILKLKWTNKKYKLSSFEKLKENKAYPVHSQM